MSADCKDCKAKDGTIRHCVEISHRNWTRAMIWQGKHAMLKHENNKLRSKNRALKRHLEELK